MSEKNKLIVYQSANGAIELKGDLGNETVWASQQQIVDIFGIDQSVVSRHIRNIFKSGEVDKESNF